MDDDELKRKHEQARKINESQKTKEEKFREDIRKGQKGIPLNREKKINPDYGRPTMERPTKEDED